MTKKQEFDMQSVKGMAAPAKGSVGRMAEKTEEREGLFAEIPAELHLKLRMQAAQEKRPLREIVTEILEMHFAKNAKS